MSFSGNVKEELVRQYNKSRHCQIAEIAAIIAFLGKVENRADGVSLNIETENTGLARKYLTLIKKVFRIEVEVEVLNTVHLNKIRSYRVSIHGEEQVQKILQTIRILDEKGNLTQGTELVNGLIVQKSCCKRAFIRGAFLASGSMSDPEKSYHFEIVCATLEKAQQMQSLINGFDMDGKIVERKNHYVVYLKEGSQIVDMLNIMEAHKCLMELENVRILKTMRNNVNRQVNCETANIQKTVSAAVRQIEDINLIEQMQGIQKLPDSLRQMAVARLEHPQAPLAELGEYLDPPVGKSGVNHRLRKLSELAENLRGKGV